MVAPAQHNSLLVLPPEIRNQIWHYTLCEARGKFLNNLRRPALAATCRQIQQEALPIFFSINQFELHLSRPFPGQEENLLLRPWTTIFLRNVEIYMPHILAVNIYATIRWKGWTGFFSVWRIRVGKNGQVRVEPDISKLVGRARNLCVPILVRLEQHFARAVQSSHTKAIGLHDLEALVNTFQPYILNGENICFGSGKKDHPNDQSLLPVLQPVLGF